MIRRAGLACSLGAAIALWAAPAFADPAPQHGGELRLAAVTDPETFDCHASTALGTAIHLLPHYSTLLRVSSASFPAVEGDLAQSWTVSDDGLTYRFQLVPDVKFHDGTPLTSADVKATFERLRHPPAGSPAPRKALFDDIESIETPDPATVVFRLSQRDDAMLYILANPWNCVYSAAKLASDPAYPASVVMGSGPFRLAEQVKGGVWRGERYAGYHRAGRPYADGFQMYSMPLTTMMNSLEGNQIDGDTRGMAPSEAARIVARYPGRFTEQQSSTLTLFMLAFNTEAAPFNDPRVRRALSMAIDRRTASAAMGKIAAVRDYGGLIRPGSALAATEDELAALPPFARDINAARIEAKRLLTEAGVPNLHFKLLLPANNQPYGYLAIYAIDQWRRIGVTADATEVPLASFYPSVANGNFQVSLDFASNPFDEPVTQLVKYLSRRISPVNNARYDDPEIDRLHAALKATSDPAEQRRLVRAIEARVLGEQSYYAPLLWMQRSVLTKKEVHLPAILPSHFLNLDLADVWLDAN